ncbi:NADH-quinone oxidoreductase subunit G [Streptosporangium becharense]|uniref:NADH-quinone oxidoreductase n=1 Tax=Streptosporangium becharense TaxID=1816182 RepID=A0A7W9MGB4_9ACTN|nr:NADH-quinone oxidoreductase subunit G [Streptosporangium becharense]MBB2909055.1 NADH-quinone oxidoreductase subunit G [Streptosporangium becharense]MBB5819927.1 NADH-quinone oxidoreductase subunit G [Streptosporangium becharense]
MTVEATTPAQTPVDLVTVTIDGFQVSVPKGTLIIRAAELLGIQIPRFCDHPLLDPAANCRQCLVDIPDAGNGRGFPKPQPSCAIEVAQGMVVQTQLTSPVAEKAQRGVMELLLMNHPLDCPVCDKGGECPLQNQAMSNGQGESRFQEKKRTFDKPVALSSEVLLDRERCVQCARCIRFSDEIAGDPLIDFFERGAKEQVGAADGRPFESYFSGNTVQICPVGALTGAAYRFQARPFDLVSTPSACEHCASGCSLRTDHRRGKVTRRLAGDDPEVNEEWNCDKGRWAFTYGTQPDRLKTPLVRDEEGRLVPASWPEAFAAAARGLAAARGRAGVLVGGRATVEEAYGYAKFARLALGTNDIDFRARPHSAEEASFLAHAVAGKGIEVRYADLEKAPAVLLVGFEPDEESPIVFLRLRKAWRKKGLRVFSVAPFATAGLAKMGGTLVPAVPGSETAVLDDLAAVDPIAAEAVRQPGAVILAGERLATVPGALSALVRLAESSGARLAWVPRRAGERGAVEAGALPNLLPIGRPVGDEAARAEVARAWNVASLPEGEGRDTTGILKAALDGEIDALVIAGVDPYDLAAPQAALVALENTPFIVSLEQRASAVTDRADVVLPVAVAAEKSGTFVNWEGRGRTFEEALRVPGVMSDLRVISAIADAMDVHLGLPDPAAARRELAAIGAWRGSRAAAPAVDAPVLAEPQAGQAVLATWHLLLDDGRLQAGEPYLAGTARAAEALVSAATAAEAGLADGGEITVGTERGSLTLPVRIADLPDRVVWLPANSAGRSVTRDLRAVAGEIVAIGPAGGTSAGAVAPAAASPVTPGAVSTVAGAPEAADTVLPGADTVLPERASGTTAGEVGTAGEANEER